MRKARPLSCYLVAFAIILSLSYNLSTLEKYTSIAYGVNEMEPSPLWYVSNKAPPPAIQVLGISSSSEMKDVILQTYLAARSDKNKHAFSNTCPLEHFTHNSSCTMPFKFLDESLSETSWWKYLFEESEFSTLHQDKSRFILWTTGETILYPKNLESDFHQVRNDASSDLFYAAAPLTDCSRVRLKADRRVCDRLSGRLTIASYETVLRTRECWSTSQDTDQCRASLNVTTHQLPRQLRQPDPQSFLDFWDKRLVSWNTLPSQISYITAKFGKASKFRSQVQHARDVLMSLGFADEQIHAYYDFPDFILNDGRWKLHLEFLDDTVIPPVRPKGGGYYFWKAPLILHHLKQLNNGDFVVYANIDHKDHNKWLAKLLKFMHTSNTSLALYETDFLERQYTKRDAYQLYCGSHQDPAEDGTLQYGSSFIVVRNAPSVQAFFYEWLEGVAHYILLNDRPSRLEEVEDFVQHKNDQSLLSVLLKCGHSQAYVKRQVVNNNILNDSMVSSSRRLHVFSI
eukprot:scaffold6241_cov129-Cylindrotheca_fusiformis.AAC.18